MANIKFSGVSNPDDDKFIKAVKGLKKEDTLEVDDGVLVLEYDMKDTTLAYQNRENFPFHQRIFEPGVILHKLESNVRIFIEKARLDEVK